MTYRGIDLDGRAVCAVDPGPAPMLQWLALDQLVIDEAYQRPLARANWKAIEKIAAHFQWSRFAPVLVAPIAGGRFAVIDGQHRTHAAAICGLAEIPAMVVQVDQAEQSRSFAWVNSQRIRVSKFHIFKAALSAGEDWALRANHAVSGGGCRLMPYNKTGSEKAAGEVYCIGLIRRQIEAGNDWAVRAGLAALRAVPARDKQASYTDYILSPWIGAVAAAGCRDVAILSAVLRAWDPFKLVEAAMAATATGGTPTGRARDALRRAIAVVVAKGGAV